MQSANASAIQSNSTASGETLSVFRTIGGIVALAVPFAVGAAVTSALHLGKIALLSRTTDTGALNTLSMLQPSFILILALMEGLAITNQVFSAKSKQNWPRRAILRASRVFSIFGIGALLVIAGIGYAVRHLVAFEDPVLQTIVDNFPLFILSLSAFVVFDVYYGAMRGQGRILLGLLPFAGLVVIDLSVTYLAVDHYGLGFDGVLIGNMAGPLIMLPVIYFLLRHIAGSGEEGPLQAFRIRIKQLFAGVGVPVFSSIIVGFISASVVFPVLARLGEDEVSAFFVVLRYRIAFMIPAIAIGSAIAILVNQCSEERNGSHRFRYLAIGVPTMLLFYLGLTALLPQWTGALDLLVPSGNADLRLATEVMFMALLVTFFLVAGSSMLQVILEQLGRGVHVLIITVLVEAGTCAAILYAMHAGTNLEQVMQILVAFAGISFALFTIQFLLLLRRVGGQDAV